MFLLTQHHGSETCEKSIKIQDATSAGIIDEQTFHFLFYSSFNNHILMYIVFAKYKSSLKSYYLFYKFYEIIKKELCEALLIAVGNFAEI